MLTFREFVHYQKTLYEENLSPLQKFDQLVDLHRITFNNVNFKEENLMNCDKEFLVGLFETLKYLKQKQNTFSTKIKGCVFEIGYFNKSRWAISLTNEQGREVTKPFQMLEGKVNPIIDLIKKGINQQTFKNIFPLTRGK